MTGWSRRSCSKPRTPTLAGRQKNTRPAAGRFFFCYPASVGVLSFEHDSRDEPIIHLWNYRG